MVFPSFNSQTVVNNMIQPMRSLLPGADIATRVFFLDLKIRQAEPLLMRLDKITMSCGVHLV
jgi:hypothetical protein